MYPFSFSNRSGTSVGKQFGSYRYGALERGYLVKLQLRLDIGEGIATTHQVVDESGRVIAGLRT
jgi:hypothetical protein